MGKKHSFKNRYCQRTGFVPHFLPILIDFGAFYQIGLVPSFWFLKTMVKRVVLLTIISLFKHNIDKELESVEEYREERPKES